MKIILAEVGEQAPRRERAFEKPLIIIGRDPAQCDIVFEQAAWPMVSRRHAEIHFRGGRCYLIDSNSTFGTYVNNHRISDAVEIAAGAELRFGADGPLLQLVGVDQAVAPLGGEAPRRAPAFTTQVMSAAEVAPAAPELAPVTRGAMPQSGSAYLEYVSGGTKPERMRLDRPRILFGRDPAADIPLTAAAAAVSRRHAEIQQRDGCYTLVDLGSFNGTLLNDLRVAQPEPLHDDDRIQLGLGGPLFRFVDPHHPCQEREAGVSGQVAPGINFQRTMVVRAATVGDAPAAETQLLFERLFGDGKQVLTIGRAADNDVSLDGLQISNYHARVHRAGDAVFIEDAGSTNGVYVNGVRLTARQQISEQDAVHIGPFALRASAARGVAVFDSRSKTRLDALNLTKTVADRHGRGTVKLLDEVSLSIQPNEFVGLLGPSGAGKSTLMDALNGMRPADGGQVLYNDLDLYHHPDSLKHAIGYVPQDDIIHRELSVYRTLYYVARLRLSRDVSPEEVDQIINEVLDVTGLAERRDVLIAQLSGGQRKRVSIAVELITKPSVIFLDEPTSGLDPATEDKIMRLFRQIAESGRTVILTTHAMENVKLFDKIVVLLRGRLVFYGEPQEALEYFAVDNFKDLYDKLESPAEAEQREQREQAVERVANEWRRRFVQTALHRRYVAEPLEKVRRDAGAGQAARHRPGVMATLRQWGILTRRYAEVSGRDRLNLWILFGQAPLIALFTYLVVGADSTRDFVYFLLALVALWFGTSVAAREVVKERAVYGRERKINLGLWPYLGSKLAVLAAIVAAQCLLLFGTLKLLDVAGLMSLPGLWGGLPQLLLMILTGLVGIALGLLVSTAVSTSEMATSIVPLLLIPQILFSGLVGVPQGAARAVGAAMPAVWSFDALKRFSLLDTLQPEGSTQTGPNKGLGLYRQVEAANDQTIAAARSDIEKYRAETIERSQAYERSVKEYLAQARANPALEPPAAPALGAPPAIPDAQKINNDLSGYVNFLHPWGGLYLSPLVLLLMFIALTGATLVALRAQDRR